MTARIRETLENAAREYQLVELTFVDGDTQHGSVTEYLADPLQAEAVILEMVDGELMSCRVDEITEVEVIDC